MFFLIPKQIKMNESPYSETFLISSWCTRLNTISIMLDVENSPWHCWTCSARVITYFYSGYPTSLSIKSFKATKYITWISTLNISKCWTLSWLSIGSNASSCSLRWTWLPCNKKKNKKPYFHLNGHITEQSQICKEPSTRRHFNPL